MIEHRTISERKYFMVCQLVVCFVIVFISEEDRDEGLSECWEFFSQIQEADGECDTSL